MSVRFRIRTPGGQELSFASHEMFEDFVRSGELSDDDLVYDRETGSWSPARTHPTVLEIQYEQETDEEDTTVAPTSGGGPASGTAPEAAGAEAAGEPSTGAELGDDDATPAADGEGGQAEEAGTAVEEPMLDMADDLGLDLAIHEEESAEEAKRRLIEKLEAEREAELDPGSIRDSLAGFKVESGSAELVRTERPGERPAPTPGQKRKQERKPRQEPRRPSPRRSPQRGTSPALAGKAASSAPARTAGGQRKEAPGKKGGLSRFLFLLFLLAVVGGGGWMGYRLLQAGPETELPEEEGPLATESEATVPTPREPGPTPPPARPAEADPSEGDPVGAMVAGADTAGGDVGEAETTPASPEPVIPATPAAVRERAQERYLTSTQAAFRDLEPIPEVWPEGPYLSVPTDHAEVVDVWQHYRSTIREVRATDAERYRTAYEAALDDAGVQGEEREERLAAAMAAFEESAPPRQAHYDRVEALATAAIQSHNALVEAEGLLLWDATGSTGPGSGIGRGVSGRDSESQLLLDQVVELLTASLDADGEGPGAPENVREWVWDGFLDAATR